MIGVLMAAGMGNRLGAGTTKALVEIEGRPLCFFAMDFLRRCGVDKIVVVGGCDFEKLKNKVAEYDKDILVIENPDFKKGNLYSFICAMPFIDDSFLLANADHIYKKAIAEKVSSQLKGITAFCDFDRNLSDDDMKVWHDNMMLKKISKTLEQFNGGYVGLTYCDKSELLRYKSEIDKMLATGEDNLVVENILRDLSANNYQINIGDISGYGWLEIDFPEELERARQSLSENGTEYFV